MLVWHVTLAFWSRRSLWGAGRFEDDANPWVESSASQPSPELPLLNSCCLVCCIPWLLPELFVELLLPPGDSPGSSAGCTTCTSDCSETQPGGVGKARKPRFNKLPAEKAATALPAPWGLQAHLTSTAATSAICCWQAPASASCPTATGSLFLLKGSCQTQHQHQ